MTRILFLTDLHDATSFLPRIIEHAAEADVVLVGGDITNFGGAKQAESVLSALLDSHANVRCVHGNLDHPEVEQWLATRGVSLHGKVWECCGLAVHGCGGANPTPFTTPSEFSEEQILEVLQAGYEQVQSSKLSHVVVTHTPPLQTGADKIMTGKHVGSTSVREFVRRTQPALCLSGHIHESACIDRLGATLVVNPGPFSSGYYAVIEIDEDRIRAERRRIQASTVRRAVVYSSMLWGKAVGILSHRS